MPKYLFNTVSFACIWNIFLILGGMSNSVLREYVLRIPSEILSSMDERLS